MDNNNKSFKSFDYTKGNELIISSDWTSSPWTSEQNWLIPDKNFIFPQDPIISTSNYEADTQIKIKLEGEQEETFKCKTCDKERTIPKYAFIEYNVPDYCSQKCLCEKINKLEERIKELENNFSDVERIEELYVKCHAIESFLKTSPELKNTDNKN